MSARNAADGQRHLRGSPDGWQEGVNALGVWDAVPGSDGAGVRVVDVEMGWRLDHPDLVAPDARRTSITVVGNPRKEHRGRDVERHGTRALGVVGALGRVSAFVGVAPGASLGVSSEFLDDGDTEPRTAQAILNALDVMEFGDVLLLEAQTEWSAGGSTYCLPAEVRPDVFDAIRVAVARGVIVVEAAGNESPDIGGVDLDAVTFHPDGAEPFSLRRGGDGVERSEHFRDSGAIVVSGARLWCDAVLPEHRWEPSGRLCFGSRVDCFAQGFGVRTLMTDPLSAFAGTSAAAAIIAGVAASVQGMCQHPSMLGRRIGPEAMRALLADAENGVRALGGGESERRGQRLGVMPDLQKIAARLRGLA